MRACERASERSALIHLLPTKKVTADSEALLTLIRRTAAASKLNERTNDGFTALHIAAAENESAVCSTEVSSFAEYAMREL